jgi:phosphate transport system permease protein
MALDHYRFKPKSRLREFLAEKIIQASAFSALLGIVLIFVFIFKESIPIFTEEEVRNEAGIV